MDGLPPEGVDRPTYLLPKGYEWVWNAVLGEDIALWEARLMTGDELANAGFWTTRLHTITEHQEWGE